jgi:NAD binding domain of 6-phosphogluconate dehydrogenase
VCVATSPFDAAADIVLTVLPERMLHEHGVRVLDAPVSGGTVGTETAP